MKVSYIKTQWFNLLVGVLNLGISIYHFCIDDQLWGIAWTLSATVWFIMSYINYNDERITLLEKKQERDDAMYDLVQELRRANEIDREHIKALEARLKKLEDKK